jgi:hypothetical protein
MTEFSDVKQWYLDTVNATVDARQKCERDRDYYDNKQLTSEEEAELKKRKQPIVISNRIKTKIDATLGLEIRSRVDIKAFPRTPKDEESAEAATDSLRYVADNSDFDQVKTDTAFNILVEGTGASICEVERTKKGFEIMPRHIPWDRFFIDPHSSRKDGKDAKFMGQAIWMDEQDAFDMFPGVDKALITAGSEDGTIGDTYDDKPMNIFFDQARSRVKLIEMYYFSRGWKHVVFTGLGAVVPERDSPYLDEDGDPINPIEMQSASVDRENNRYGPVRQLISPQDEINKRRSKALHLLSVRQVVADKGAVANVNKAKTELAKPDGWIEKNPNKSLEIQSTTDLAAGQINLLAEAKSEIDAIGANASVTGKEERSLSGRALQVRQEAGTIELAPVLDGLRNWELRMYRQMWMRIKQFWTEERWIRVTDDEKNIRFVGLNRPVTAGEVLQEQGQMFDVNDPRANQVVGVQNAVAELDVDIILEAVPDTVNIQAEQFELLANIYSANPNAVPFEMIIESSSLRNKERILERMNGATPEEQEAVAERNDLEKRGAVAEITATEAKAAKDAADAKETQVDTLIKVNQPIQQ